MICEKCTKTIDDDSKFCSFCGNKIETKELENEITNITEIKTLEDKNEEAVYKKDLDKTINKPLNNEIDKKSTALNSKFKSIGFRIIAIIFAYFGFVAIKVWSGTKGVSYGEVTLLSLFVFLAIYKIVVGYSLNIKSSKNMGIWFVVISIFLVFISVIYEVKGNDTFISDELRYLKNQTPKQIDENTTLLSVNINKMSVEFKYHIDNVNIDNMTEQSKKDFEQIVKTGLCQEQVFIEVMNNNYNLNMKYLDKNFQIIGEVNLSKEQCK
ncbi:zinc ribbon domain-containing protein [Aliarcobacter cryaerophilus]|uniref:hypothetical protein n=1 Tax=Aliarcobacter cryaerophilus TaxID=28198 RepID=UPI003DA5AC95